MVNGSQTSTVNLQRGEMAFLELGQTCCACHNYFGYGGRDPQLRMAYNNGVISIQQQLLTNDYLITALNSGTEIVSGVGLSTCPGQPTPAPVTINVSPTSVSQTPSVLNLSTGDTTKTITTTVNPSISFTPAFAWGLQSNLNSSSTVTLSFSDNSGNGSVNTTITAAPPGGSGIFNAVAVVGQVSSSNSTQIIVPPQIMIQTAVGEAGAQTATGDASIPSLLLVAKNRFGDASFPGGAAATWQAVLTGPNQFAPSYTTMDGASVPTELNYAAAVFAGTTNVSIPAGCKGFWSPTNTQFSTLQQWASQQAGSIPDSNWSSPRIVGAPTLWVGQPKQAVIMSSIANNVGHGQNYSSAPAFVLFQLAPSGTAPAVITIP